MKTRVIDNMLIAEYDPELHMQVRLEEAREEGEYRGKVSTARNMKAKDCDISFIAEMTGLTLEEVKSI